MKTTSLTVDSVAAHMTEAGLDVSRVHNAEHDLLVAGYRVRVFTDHPTHPRGCVQFTRTRSGYWSTSANLDTVSEYIRKYSAPLQT